MDSFAKLGARYGPMVRTEHDTRWRLPHMVRIPNKDREQLDGELDGRTADRFFYGTTLEEAAAKALQADR